MKPVLKEFFVAYIQYAFANALADPQPTEEEVEAKAKELFWRIYKGNKGVTRIIERGVKIAKIHILELYLSTVIKKTSIVNV